VAYRLAQRWVGAHLFSGELPGPAVELIVAHCFLRAAPLPRPSQESQACSGAVYNTTLLYSEVLISSVTVLLWKHFLCVTVILPL